MTDVNYGYTLRNNIDGMTDNLDPSLDQNFTYDNIARLTDATGTYGVQSYSFDAIGNRLSKTQDSVTETYQYEANSHRLSSVGLTNLSFDPIGNTLTKGELSFSYNQMGRMVTASKTGMDASYQYNAQGERVKKTVNSETTLYHYDQAGQLIAQTDDQGAIIQEYIYLDGMRLATMGKAKLATVTLDEEQASLSGSWSAVSNGAYQGDAQVAVKLRNNGNNPASATWTTNLWQGTYEVYAQWFTNNKHATNAPYSITHANGTDTVTTNQKSNGGAWQLLGTYDFNGSTNITLSNDADGKVVADAIRFVPVSSSPQIFYAHSDHLGSPIALTDQAGIVQWKGSYDPYGNVTVELDNLSQELRFPGQILDPETGMHYNYFRDYDPEIGRYLQSDPMGLSDGPSTYSYTGANPVNYFDVNGLSRTGRRGGPSGSNNPNQGVINQRYDNLVNQIRRYDPTFRHETVRPSRGQGSYRNERDLRQLESALSNAKNAGFCGPGAASGRYSNKRSPKFIVDSAGNVYPVPTGATGPTPVINGAGNITGSAFTGGSGGANGQVSLIRLMNPTPPRGASPGYPDGYITFGNNSTPRPQNVDPYTGRVLPRSEAHFPINGGCSCEQ